jgi:hypothetical protein
LWFFVCLFAFYLFVSLVFFLFVCLFVWFFCAFFVCFVCLVFFFCLFAFLFFVLFVCLFVVLFCYVLFFGESKFLEIPVADPGISEQGGAVEVGGSGGCLGSPSRSRAEPWWGSRGEAPGS